jgi:PKD repeat protein
MPANDNPYTYAGTFSGTDDESWAANAVGFLTTNLPLELSIAPTNTSGPVPYTVDFTSSPKHGAPGYFYAWDFGDGDTSTAANPSHTYVTTGVFSGHLTVTDYGGNTATVPFTVTVEPAEPVTGYPPYRWHPRFYRVDAPPSGVFVL